MNFSASGGLRGCHSLFNSIGRTDWNKQGSMSEENNNLPALTTYEELSEEEKQRRWKELESYWLDPTKDYPEPHFLYEFNGVGFSPLGGIQALSGQKKNGKTFVLSILMAVALGNGKQRIIDFLPGLRIRQSTLDHLGHAPRVLYCDTEMEQLNTAKVLRRVHWLCDWDMKQQYDNFHVLWLREVPKGEGQSANHERWRLIQMAIEQKSPDIVFIDGMRDLMDDFNDLKESSTIIGEMMSLASQRNMCIWNVLHMNPRPGNDDESKMRGHAGTELGNKVSDTFISTKKKDATTGQVTFTVKQQDARSKDVDDFQFIVCDDAGGLGIPKIISGASTLQQSIQQAKNEEEIMLKETVRVLKGIIYPPQSEFFSNLVRQAKKELRCGEEKCKKYIYQLIDVHPGIIYQLNDGKWTMSKAEVEAFENDMPFTPPSDDDDEIF